LIWSGRTSQGQVPSPALHTLSIVLKKDGPNLHGGFMLKRGFLVLAGLSLMAGCGGGGGGSSSGGNFGYTGVTTQASVTSSNAKALSVDAYSGTQISSATTGVAKEAGDTNGQSALLQQAAGILERSALSSVTASKSTSKAVAASVAVTDTINGFSGSYSYSITVDPFSGAFSGTVSFSQYKETFISPTISGAMTFSGVYNQSTGAFSGLNISLSNLNGTEGGKSFNMAGTLAYSTVGATNTISMSVVLTDNLSGRTFWLKDFTLVQTGTSLTVTGTYYDPIYGYVTISTVTPVTAATLDATPTSGQLLFSGSNGTKARLTFTSGGSTVEVDSAGNGIYVVVP
jgi:hypothetical protein